MLTSSPTIMLTSPFANPGESVPFAHNPIAITTLISDYRNTLPKIELGNTSIRSLYLANAQACSAYLRLQRNLAFLDTQAMEECLDSIRDLFVTDSDCDLSTLHHLSPVIGVRIHTFLSFRSGYLPPDYRDCGWRRASFYRA